MKKLHLTFLAILMFTNINIVSPEEFRPWLDGDQWKKLDSFSKHGYILGFLQGNVITTGLIARYTRENNLVLEQQWEELLEELNDLIFTTGANLTQQVEGVDKLYEDYANKKIPVYCLITLVCKQTSVLLTDTERVKKMFSSCGERK